jgi:hypothetical protein
MEELIAGYALAAYALSLNALLEELSCGRITAPQAEGVITRSRSLIAALNGIDRAVVSAADGLLASSMQLVAPFRTPPTASAH